MLPGSEPWSGSVRPKQPIHSPVASFGRYFRRCASRAVGVDREHHERALHAHHRAVARVDALDLARDQAVADVVEAGAAVLGRQRRAEQPERAHLAERSPDRTVSWRNASRHARQQLVLRVRVRGVAHHPLLLGQLVVEQQRIVPVEPGLAACGQAFGGVHRRTPGGAIAQAEGRRCRHARRVGDDTDSPDPPAPTVRRPRQSGTTAVASISTRARVLDQRGHLDRGHRREVAADDLAIGARRARAAREVLALVDDVPGHPHDVLGPARRPRPAPRRCWRAPAAPAPTKSSVSNCCARVPADLAADEHERAARGDAVGVALRRGPARRLQDAQPALSVRMRVASRAPAVALDLPQPEALQLAGLGARQRRRRIRSRADTCTARSSASRTPAASRAIAVAGVVPGLQHDERLDDLPALVVRRRRRRRIRPRPDAAAARPRPPGRAML